MGCHFTIIGCNDKWSRYHSPIIKQWSQDKQSLEEQSLHSRLVMADIPGGSTKAPNSIMLSVKGCAEDMTSKRLGGGFPGGTVGKNLPVNAGDTGSIPNPGRFHMLGSS